MGNSGGLMNSYEIYGEQHPDEVDADYGEDEEPQYEPQYQEAFDRNMSKPDSSQDGGQISHSAHPAEGMISGEHVIE